MLFSFLRRIGKTEKGRGRNGERPETRSEAVRHYRSGRMGESGNVFFTLFGAVALVGVVGVATSTLMRGPVGTVVKLNQVAKAEAEMQIAQRLAMLEAVESDPANAGDCDADTYVEPLAPDSCGNGLTGGGCLPSAVGSSKTDPWGTDYGYCAWDHGTVIGDACVGGGVLDGTDSESQTSIAIISAGPDRNFQTECAAHPTYVDRDATSDDIILDVNYAGAVDISGGLWALKSGDPNTATVGDRDIEVGGEARFESAARFGGSVGLQDNARLEFLGNNSYLQLPDETASGTCNGPNTGVLRRNTTSGQVVEICDPTAPGDGWVEVGGSGSIAGAAGATAGDIQFRSTAVGAFDADTGGVFNYNPALDTLYVPNAELSAGLTAATVTATGDIVLGGTITDSDGDVTIGEALVVSGNINGNTITGSALVAEAGGLTSTMGTTNLGITNATDLTATTVDTGSLFVSAGTVLGGTLQVDGDISDGDSNVTIADSLDITEDVFARSFQDINGGASHEGMFFSAGNLTLETDGNIALSIDQMGDVTVENHLDVMGDVGIGITNPAVDLDVAGAIRVGMRNICDLAVVGALRYVSGSDELEICSPTGDGSGGWGWTTIGTANGGGGGIGGLWTDETDYIRYENSTFVVKEGQSLSFSSALEGAGTRFIWYPSAGSLRAGTVTGTEWDDGQVGQDTAAFGNDVQASGDYSFAIGRDTRALANHSMAFGLGEATGTVPQVDGEGSLGIFMGDQSGRLLSDTNTMGIYGGDLRLSSGNLQLFEGDMIISDGTETTATGALLLDVEGKIGATQYCSPDDNFCFTPQEIATGSVGAPGNDTEVIFNSGGALGTDPGFVFLRSSGNLGIGTNTPQKALHIVSEDPDITLEFSGTPTGGIAGIDFVSTGGSLLGTVGGNRQTGTMYMYGQEGFEFLVWGAGEVMRLTSAGRLGIGTTTPGTQLHLTEQMLLGNVDDCTADTQGALRLNAGGDILEMCDFAGSGGYIAIGGASVAAPGSDRQVVFNSGGALAATAGFVFDSSGRLGVGTATPAAQLDVAGDIVLSGDIELSSDDARIRGGMTGGFIGINEDNVSATASSNNMLLSSPTNIFLTIDDNANAATNVLSVGHDGDDPGGAGWQELFRISEDGVSYFSTSLGIGDSTPDLTLLLDVEGQIGADQYCDENGTFCFLPEDVANNAVPGANTEILFNSGGVLGTDPGFVFLRSSGRLGIGTAAPDHALHIFGDAIRLQSARTDITLRDTDSTMSGNDLLDSNLFFRDGNNSIAARLGFINSRIFALSTNYDDLHLSAQENLVLFTSGESRMVVTPDGNVGIGTDTPDTILYVSGNVPGDNNFVATIENSGDDGEFLRMINDLGNNVIELIQTSSGAGQIDLLKADGTEIGIRLDGDDGQMIVRGTSGWVRLTDTDSFSDAADYFMIDSGTGSGEALEFSFYDDSAGSTQSIIQFASTGLVRFESTGAMLVNRGVTGERPAVPENGMFRYNTTNDQFEVYEAGNWVNVITGGLGGTPAGGADRQVQFNSGGSLTGDAGFVFTSVGRLGLGTAAPGDRLHVVAPSDDDAAAFVVNDSSTSITTSEGVYIINSDTTDNNYALLQFADSVDGFVSGMIGTKITDHANNYGDLQFWTRGPSSNGIRMHIDEDGSVGIGTTTPGTSILYVSGSTLNNEALVTIENTGDGGEFLSAVNDLGNPVIALNQRTNGSGVVRIRDGLGDTRITLEATTGDTGKISLNSSGFVTGGEQDLELFVFGDTGSINYCDEAGNDCFTAADVALLAGGSVPAPGGDRQVVFNSGGSFDAFTDFVFTSTGNLGIGTASPDELLEIGNGVAPPIFTTDPDKAVLLGTTVDGEEIAYQLYANDGTNNIRTKLYVDDAALWTGIDYSYGTSLNGFSISMGGTQQMVIDVLGNVGIGSTTPQTRLDVDGTLKMAYGGEACDANRQGAIHFDSSDSNFYVCQDGANWQRVVTTGGGGGGLPAAGADSQIQFNSGNELWADANFVYTSAGDFIVGSPQINDTGTGTEDSRMFFYRSASAFRAGSVEDDRWDDGNIGQYSVAMGQQVRASNWHSFAFGLNATASGGESFVMGSNVQAQSKGMALGYDAEVGGADYNMAIGLGDASSPLPAVTGGNALGIFMGAQDGVLLASANTMGVFGGRMIIDPSVPANVWEAHAGLDVDAAVRIAFDGETCAGNPFMEGAIRFDANTFSFCADSAGDWESITLGSGTLAALSDTNITTPQTGELLYYSGSEWVNGVAGNDREVFFNSGGLMATDAGFIFTSAGNLGIGVASTDARVDVFSEITSNAAGFNYVGDYYMVLDPVADQPLGPAHSTGTSNNVISTYLEVDAGNTNRVNIANSMLAGLENYGTGEIIEGRGVHAYLGNYGAATITDFIAIKSDAYTEAGNVSRLVGLQVDSNVESAAATVDDVVGIFIGSQIEAASSVADRYGIFIDEPLGGGTPTTNDFGIYQAGAQPNYFGGALQTDSVVQMAFSGEVCAGNAAMEGAIRFDSVANAFSFCANEANDWETVSLGAGVTELDDLADAATNYTSGNMFLGQDSGIDMTSGISNTFFGFKAGEDTTEGIDNVFIGERAGQLNTTGEKNVFIGQDAGKDNLTGSGNVFIGEQAGEDNSGDDNLFIGQTAGESNQANDNIFIGKAAGQNNTLGASNVFIGENSGQNNAGSDNLFLGQNVGQNNLADDNVFIGQGAAIMNSSGGRNVFIGENVAAANTIGSNNVVLGQLGAATLVDGDDNILIGKSADVLFSSQSNFLNIGDTIFGDLAGNQIGIGTTSAQTALDVDGTLKIAFDGETCAGNPAMEGAIRFDSNTFSFCADSAGDWESITLGSGTLAALSDTNITTPQTGELLYYSGSEWVNGVAGDDREIFFNSGGTMSSVASFVFTSVGRLGLGTDSPVMPLHITSDDPDFLLDFSATPLGDWAEIGFADQGTIKAQMGYDRTTNSLRLVYDRDATGTGEFLVARHGDTRFLIDNDGDVGIGTDTPRAFVEFASSGAIILPAGDSAARPTTLVDGMIRYNSALQTFEGVENNAWVDLTGGGSGGGGDEIWQDSGSGYIEYANALGGVKLGTTSGGATPVSNFVDILNDLSDVNASPTGGQALVYNSVSGLWEAGTISSGSLGAAGGDRQIQFNSNGSFASDPLLSLSSASVLTLGTDTPANADIFGSNSFRMHIVSETGTVPADVLMGTFGGGPGTKSDLDFVKARGTIDSPNDTAIGDQLGSIRWSGYASGGFWAAAQIQAVVSGISGPSVAADLSFRTGGAGNETMLLTSAGRLGLGTSAPRAFVEFADTGAIILPAGLDADRPTTGVAGMIRFSSESNVFEGFDGTQWEILGADAGGAISFASLSDTPANYTGAAGQFVRVNSGATGVEFTDEIIGKVGGAAPVGMALNDLADVVSAGVTDGQTLIYDSVSGTWVPGAAAGSSGTGGKWLDGVGADEIYYNSAFVGIGTNDPDAELHVVGNIRLSNALKLGVQTGIGTPEASTTIALNNLSDVDTTGVADDNVLLYSAGSWVVGTVSGGGGGGLWSDSGSNYIEYSNALGGIKVGGDTGYAAPVSGSASGGGASNLNDLGDVDAGSPGNGECLAYNTGSGNWEASSSCGSGGSGLWTAGSGDNIYYNSGTTPRVGIGLTSPSVALDVAGDIKLDNSLIFTPVSGLSAPTYIDIGSGGGGGGGSEGSAIIDQYETQGMTIDPVTISATNDKWPDFILCDTSSVPTVLYLAYYNSSGSGTVSYRGDFGFGNYYNFEDDGTYMGRDQVDANCGASGNDIDSICDDDRCGLFGDGGSGGGSSLWTDGGGGDIYWNTGTPQVGIGEASPDVALDVVGDIEYTGTITDVSDMRLKTDITPLDSHEVIGRLSRIDTYSFRMKGGESGRLELGVMAQEVEKVFPELVRTADDEMGTKSVNYVGFIAPLIEASKELKAENDTLRAELAALQARQAEILQEVKGLKAHTGYGINKAQIGLWMIVGMMGAAILFFLGSVMIRRRRNAG